jgi:peptide/nickel transport system permease protein
MTDFEPTIRPVPERGPDPLPSDVVADADQSPELRGSDRLPPLPPPAIHASVKRQRRWRAVYWRALCGLILLILITGIAGPLIYPLSPLSQDLTARLLPIGSTNGDTFHLLGTDELGRDALARILVGIRVSVIVALTAVLIGTVIGASLGLLSGYFGGWVDGLIMRLVDMQMAIPFLVFAMVLSAILGPGLVNTIIALGVTSWVVYARVVRSEVLSLRSRDYVDSARALGVGSGRVMLRHIFPNTFNNLVVIATLEIGHMIIIEASLSFIGLGVQPPEASLGSMVARGQSYVFNAWWVSAIPGVAILLVTLAFVLFGDALRDRLDPRRR